MNISIHVYLHTYIQQDHTYSQWTHLEEQQTGTSAREHACGHCTQSFAVDQEGISVSSIKPKQFSRGESFACMA